MTRARDISDEAMVALYRKHRSVTKVGNELGIAGQTVYKRLAPLGVIEPINVFTDADRDRLRRDYQLYRSLGRVADLAREMGRTTQFLSRQARVLGLTEANYEKKWKGHWKYMEEPAAAVLLDTFKASRLNLTEFCAKHGLDDDGFRRTMRRFFADEWEHVIESKARRQSRYRQGRALEYRARDWLRDHHGFFVMRSAASKSPLDLIAVRHGLVLFIQCKRGGALVPAEWNAVFDLAGSVGAVPVLGSCPEGDGLEFWRLTDRKDGSRRRQPMERMDEFCRGRFSVRGSADD